MTTPESSTQTTREPLAIRHFSLPLAALLLLILAPVTAAIQATPLQITDDSGHLLKLTTPARRIISLAPNITELLYAAGAGAYIVGTTSYSDYPPAARQIPRIGDHSGLDLEAILGLQPDLIIAWPSGNPQAQLQKLQTLGLTIYNAEPQRLEDIPRTIEQLGLLSGTTTQAASSAADFRQRLQGLRQHYQGLTPVRVFFQIWEQPLLTINGQHLINDVIELCGGHNIFAGSPLLTPQISIEAVLLANPEAIITSSNDNTSGQPASLQHWHTWENLDASRNGHLYGIDPAQISRHTPRILTGAQLLCEDLQQVRRQTKNNSIRP